MEILKIGFDRFYLVHVKDNIWVYPIWSNDISIPKYGNSNSFKNSTYRLGIFEISDKEEQRELLKVWDEKKRFLKENNVSV
jgi:hypothetical protein